MPDFSSPFTHVKVLFNDIIMTVRSHVTAAGKMFQSSPDLGTQSVGQWASILALVLFVLSNIVIIVPISIPIPHRVTAEVSKLLWLAKLKTPGSRSRRRYVRLNYISVPLFAVLLLLATRAIDGSVIKRGIIGADGVQPLNIMALFISLAYMAISLDFTGLLRFSAFWVARRGGASGRRLYLFLYIFFVCCGVIVGNDPVILSGTAFLAYFTRVTGITPPTAWIFSQFTAANMASVVLVSSNPTNLVLSGGFSISFVKYTAHVILPFIAAAVLVYPVFVFVLYRSETLIPRQLQAELGDEDQSTPALVDPHGAIFGSALLLATLAVLVGTSTVGVPVWQVTVPPALLMLCRDALHDWRKNRIPSSERNLSNGSTRPPSPDEYPMQQLSPQESQSTQVVSPATTSPRESSPTTVVSEPSSTKAPVTLGDKLSECDTTLSACFPNVMNIIRRLPIPLIPFAFLMFILVQALSAKGWVEVFAGWWSAWIDKTGTLGAIGGMAFVSCIMCNVCGTNIGATILLARVLQVWISANDVDPRTKEGAIYALALGSNYGAFSLTFSASLAGLLWRQILRQKGIHVRPMQFLKLNLPVTFVAMLASTAVLAGEVYITHRNDE